MATNNRFSKPVAFNKANAEDQTILNHVEPLNFSGYVKDLIMADILKGENETRHVEADNGLKMDVSKMENGGIKIVVIG